MASHGSQNLIYFEISPVHQLKKQNSEKKEEFPVLRLTQFTHAPKITFDKVQLGFQKEKKLLILNPKDQEQHLFCDRCPSEEKGFFVEPKELILSPSEKKEVTVLWKPQTEGNIRELIHWKTNLGVRAQTVLLGTCWKSSSLKKSGKPISKHALRPYNDNTSIGNVKYKQIPQNSKPLKKVRYREQRCNIENLPPVFTTHMQRNKPELTTKSGKSMQEAPALEDCELCLGTSIYNQKLSPARRQTFIKRSSSESEHKDETAVPRKIVSCSEKVSDKSNLSYPVERKLEDKLLVNESEKNSLEIFENPVTSDRFHREIKNYLKADSTAVPPAVIFPSSEIFTDGNIGLPDCIVAASPMRRQTYIKRSWEENQKFLPIHRKLPETSESRYKVEPASPVKTLHEVATDDICNSCIFAPVESTRTNCSDELLDLSWSPVSTALLHKRKNLELKLSCMNLLQKLDCSDYKVEPSSAHSFPRIFHDMCDSGDKDNIKGFSYSLPDIANKCLNIKITDDSMSKVRNGINQENSCNSENSDNELMHTAPVSPAFITAPSTPDDCIGETTLVTEDAESEKTQEFPTPQIGNVQTSATQDMANFHSTQSFGIIKSKTGIDETETFNGPSEPLVSGFSMKSEPRLNIKEGKDNFKNCLNSSIVTSEMATLHGSINIDDIQNIETSNHCLSSTILEDNFFPVNDALPSLQNTIVQCDNSSYDSDSLNDVLLCQGTMPQTEQAGNLSKIHPFSFKVTLEGDSTIHPRASDESLSMASLADFSFLPAENPRCCSTVIKSQNLPSGFEMKNNSNRAKKLFGSASKRAAANTPDTEVLFCTATDNTYMHSKTSIMNIVNDCKGSTDCDMRAYKEEQPSVVACKAGDLGLPTNGSVASMDSEVESKQKQSLTFIAISPPPKPVKPMLVCRVDDGRYPNKAPQKHFSKSSFTGKLNKPVVQHSSLDQTGKASRYQLCHVTREISANKLPAKFHQSSSLDSSNGTAVSDDKTAKSMLSSLSLTGSVRDVRRPGLKLKCPMLSQSRLLLHRVPKSSFTLHPNPFAAKNMYYDDRWIEKQMSGFTKWINFVLTPPEEESTAAPKKVDVAKLWMEANRCTNMQKAPTREIMSLKAYTARKRLGNLRRAACNLYQSSEIASVIARVEMAIEKKLLIIRKDRQSHADMGLKQEMLHLLLSYNPLWLRIGLETVYGEVVMLSSHTDIAGLSQFVVNRLINCPYIARTYAHPTVPHCYKQGFEEALKVFQLKKFLLLVYFLDRAKCKRLIDHDPCLFRKDSEFKSSRDILLAFAREFLCGVGDITKHLAYMKYTVTHQQLLLDEFEYAVCNLATDLRCGIRLTRVAEILTEDYSLSARLRLPAVSRLQKVHNTDVALTALEMAGNIKLNNRFPAKDIVDGHREKTLELLWELIFHFQIKRVLSVSKLLEEIRHLRRTLLIKSSSCQRVNKEMLTVANEKLSEKESSSNCSTEFILQLLKLWSQLVCAFYGLPIENMTVSFCDGRAFCYLLHHYHSDLLQQCDIKLETMQNVEFSGSEIDDSMDDDFSKSLIDNEEISLRLRNEKSNFSLFIRKLNELGSVPILIHPTDMINTIPDEKVTTTFLAYFCARLLDLSAEIKAARVIQLAWRKLYAAKKEKRLEVMMNSCRKIQSWWRKQLLRKKARLYAKAATVIQSHWRKRKSEQLLLQLKIENYQKVKNEAAGRIQSTFRFYMKRQQQRKVRAAVQIQKTWRAFSEKNKFIQTKKLVIQMQSWARMKIARRKYQQMVRRVIWLQRKFRQKLLLRKIQDNLKADIAATTIIQRYFRSYLAEKVSRLNKYRNEATTKIASFFRMVLLRKRFLKQRNAATILQKYFRGKMQRRKYLEKLVSVTIIQRQWRSCLVSRNLRKQYLELRCVVIIIQSFVRAYLDRKRFVAIRNSTVMIQSAFRGCLARKIHCRRIGAALIIQRWWRVAMQRKKDREHMEFIQDCAVRIQTNWRTYKCRKLFIRAHKAAGTIQSYFRGWLQQKKYEEKLKAVLKIQTCWKMYRAQKIYLKMRNACCVIQSHWRTHLAVIAFNRKISAIFVIQRYYRAYRLQKLCHKKYQQIRGSIIFLQAAVRGFIARKHIQQLCHSVVAIQAAARGCKVRSELHRQKTAAAKIVAWFRGYRLHQEYLRKKMAAVTIQQAFRSLLYRRIIQAKTARVTNGAIVIQSCFRGFMVRKAVRHMNSAATKIQSFWRLCSCRKNYKVMKAAAICIQHFYINYKRSSSVRQEYLMKRKGIVTLQKYVRGYLKRIRYQSIKVCVIKIQSHWRMKMAHKHYCQIVKATTLVQNFYRKQKAMHMHRAEFLIVKSSVIKIQAMIRGYLCRRKYKEAREAAIKIQSFWRMTKSRKQFHKVMHATEILQNFFKNEKLARQERRKFLSTRTSVICCQAVVRGHICRKQLHLKHEAVVKIQCYYRASLQRKKYLKIINASCVIQTRFRDFMRSKETRYQYLKIRQNIILLQAISRGHLVRQKMERHHLAATEIQAAFRKYICRRQFLRMKSAVSIVQRQFTIYLEQRTTREVEKRCAGAVKIQSCCRGYLLRKQFKKEKCSAILIQSYVRMISARNIFLKSVNAVRLLQKHWRATLLMRIDSKKFSLVREATIIIQSVWRGYRVRKNMASICQAAICIQSNYRFWIQNCHYQRQKKNAIKIQQWWRRQLITLSLQEEYQMKRQATIIIQRYFKIWQFNREIKKAASSTKIQSFWKMFQHVKQYRLLRKSAVIIQLWWRAHLEAKRAHNYLYFQGCLMKSQAHCKGLLTGRNFQNLRLDQERENAAVKIQTWWRARTLALKYRKKKEAAIKLQRYWRGALKTLIAKEYFIYLCRASIIIQSAWRGRQQRKEYMRMKAAAITIQMQQHCGARKIQASWRGYSLRQKMLSDRRLTMIRERLIDATTNACESNTIGNKTTVAITYLLHFKDLKRTLLAVMYLDASTKWSPTCCEKLVAENGHIMVVQLARSCNRSVPHLEILGLAISVLINLVKYRTVLPNIQAIPNLVSTIINLMRTYHVKGQTVFTKCCTLLYILNCTSPPTLGLHAPSVKKDIDGLCTVMTRRSVYHVKSASKRPLKHFVLPLSHCPTLLPEWSLVSSAVREFTDPLSAITTLSEKLSQI